MYVLEKKDCVNHSPYSSHITNICIYARWWNQKFKYDKSFLCFRTRSCSTRFVLETAAWGCYQYGRQVLWLALKRDFAFDTSIWKTNALFSALFSNSKNHFLFWVANLFLFILLAFSACFLLSLSLSSRRQARLILAVRLKQLRSFYRACLSNLGTVEIAHSVQNTSMFG